MSADMSYTSVHPADGKPCYRRAVLPPETRSDRIASAIHRIREGLTPPPPPRDAA